MESQIASGGTIANTIVWGNTPHKNGSGEQIYYLTRFTNRINNALASQNSTHGGVNLTFSDNDANLGPRFVNPENNDFRLKDNSACIDAGNDTYLTAYSITADLDGNVRKVGESIDIGAYEHQSSNPATSIAVAQTSENVTFYPNPATDYILLSDKTIGQVRIYSFSGVLLQNSRPINGRISLEKLPRGSYLVNTKTFNGENNSVLLVK